MRRTLAALALVLVGTALLPVPPVAAGTGPKVGIVDSELTYINFAQFGWWQGRATGAISYLTSAGYDVVVLSDDDLDNRSTLDTLDVLFLPMTRVIEENAANTIVDWVADGGGLVGAFIGPRMHTEPGCQWSSATHPRDAGWTTHWNCGSAGSGGFDFWFRTFNSNAWEAGPLSVMYGTRLINDPTPNQFSIVQDESHPIVSNTLSELDISSINLDRNPPGAGAEFTRQYNNLTDSFLKFSIPPGTTTAEGIDAYQYNNYTAAQATQYGKGRVVYYDFGILDFLPQVNFAVSQQMHQGVTQGEIAGELLEQSISWADAASGTVAVAAVARTWGEVDAWNGAIYVRQKVEAVGTHAVHGTAHIRIKNPSGALVYENQTVLLGLYPGQGPLQYSYGYTPGSLQSGQYTVEIDLIFTYPDYDQIHLERALVTKGQGTNILTQTVTSSALPERYAGSDRYATAAVVSANTFSPGVPVAYVAVGSDFPDALAGVPAAIRRGGPILLTRTTSIPAATASELSRLNPAEIVVLGGTAAVSSTVESQLAAYTSGPVRRLAGSNRFGTAAAISQDTFPSGSSVVYVATGSDFPDALAAGPIAGLNDGPVLLTTKDSLPSVTRNEILRLGPSQIVILGGDAAVSPAVAAELGTLGASVSRLAGSHRYSTAALASQSEFSPGIPVAFISIGTNFPDALAGGVAAGVTGGPVLLVSPGALPASTAGELNRLNPVDIIILGGEGAVSSSVAAQLAGYEG